MKIVRHIQYTRLHSFDDPIGDVPILFKKLKNWQEDFCSELKLELVDIKQDETLENCLYFEENLYFSKDFLKQALGFAKDSNESIQFCFQDNVFNRRFVFPHDSSLEQNFDFYYISSKINSKDIKKEQFKKVYLEQKLYEYEANVPKQIISSGEYNVPQCATYACHIISPFHLLYVNLAVNLNRTIALQKGQIVQYFKNRKGRIFSRLYFLGLKRLNRIGKNCFIHPTAVIEGSVIGDNVKIGAHSIVRLSTIGNNVSIADNVVVANSVIGARSQIANSNYIELCMSYEEVFAIHGPYQFTIFGKQSACFAIINCDIRLDQKTIKIPTSEGILDSRQHLLGIAYGHRSKTGGGNIIASGRIVPNDRITNPPNNIILKF